jgi:hypothetical protein
MKYKDAVNWSTCTQEGQEELIEAIESDPINYQDHLKTWYAPQDTGLLQGALKQIERIYASPCYFPDN